MSKQDDLGPLPRLHRREQLTQAAKADLTTAMYDLFRRHALTDGEVLRIVTAVFSEYIIRGGP